MRVMRTASPHASRMKRAAVRPAKLPPSTRTCGLPSLAIGLPRFHPGTRQPSYRGSTCLPSQVLGFFPGRLSRMPRQPPVGHFRPPPEGRLEVVQSAKHVLASAGREGESREDRIYHLPRTAGAAQPVAQEELSPTALRPAPVRRATAGASSV